MNDHAPSATVAMAPPATTTAGAAEPSRELDIFISYCQKEELAELLCDLIRTALYGDDVEAARKRVFYTGAVETGLRPGAEFNAMLKGLEQARCVVAVVTRETRNSIAMQAEMALANASKKLIPTVARESYRQLLTWPFAETQASTLDDELAVRQLIDTVGEKIGRQPTYNEEAEKKCGALVKRAKEIHHPIAPPRKTWPLAGVAVASVAVAVAALAGFWGGARAAVGPRLVAVDGTPIDGTEIHIVHQSTLPRKRLSSRLHELRSELGDETTTAEVHRVFMDVLKATNTQWGFSDATLKELEGIVTRWTSGNSGVENAGNLTCDKMPVALDRDWCALLAAKLDSKVTQFDDTKYAIARIGSGNAGSQPPAVVMISGKAVPGKPSWMVQDIGTVLLRITP
jgi:hypothetical protein